MVVRLEKIDRHDIHPVPQDESLATRCRKLSKDMGRIDWSCAADVIERYVRGLNPWPSAYTQLDGRQLKIWKAEICEGLSGHTGEVVAVDKESITVACGNSAIRLLEIQLEGKKRMETSAFLLGYRISVGDHLG